MGLSDKATHFFVSFATTLIVCAFLGGIVSVRKRLQYSGLITFSIGLVKELGDGWLWKWPWCPCTAEWEDLASNLLGIGMALIALIQVSFVYSTVISKPRTSSSSIEENSGDGI
jgi:hypothetical protein